MNLRIFLTSPCLLVAGMTPVAQAHDAWIEPRDGGYVVLYGHGEKLESYAADKVKSVRAVDGKGRPMAVRVEAAAQPVRVRPKGRPALFVLHFDNGFWSQTTDGWKNVPKNETQNPLASSHAVKFGKTVLAWNAATPKPQGLQLEILPLSDRQPAAGDSLPVQVRWEGAPLVRARITRAEYGGEKVFETDADGKASLPVLSGRQLIEVTHTKDLPNDSRADVYAASANLVFFSR